MPVGKGVDVANDATAVLLGGVGSGELLPLEDADPTGIIQRALCGWPTGQSSCSQDVLALLMTLPRDDEDPLQASRSILSTRLPSVQLPASPIAAAVRELLRYIASHRKRRSH